MSLTEQGDRFLGLNNVDKVLDKIKSSMLDDLAPIADENASRGHNYYGYFSHYLIIAVPRFDASDIQFIFNSASNNTSWKANEGQVFNLISLDIKGLSEPTVLRLIISALLASIARKKITIIPASYRFSAPFGHHPIRILQRKNNPFLHFFPLFARELLLVSTPSRFDNSKEFLTYDWSGIESNLKHYKSWNKSANDIMNAMCAHGVDDPKDITAELIGEYRRSRISLGEGEMAWTPVIAFIDLKYGTNKLSSCRKYIEDNPVYRGELSQNKKLDLQGSLYNTLQPKEAQSASCLLLDKNSILVLEPKKKTSHINIEEYSCAHSNLNSHATEFIDKSSLWYKSQYDYLHHDDPEKGTLQHRNSAMKLLNTYLFDYLPYFFNKTKTAFQYPDTPDKFFGFVFVKPSLVYEQAMFESSENKNYPASIIDFIILFSDLRRRNGTQGDNLSREALSILERYFRYIQSNFGAIDGLKIESNPFQAYKKKLGAKYSKSNKKKFELNYWLYFRVFIKETSKYVMLKAAQQMLYYAENSQLDSIQELKKIIKDLEHFIKVSSQFEPICVENIIQSIPDNIIRVNSKIDLDENFKSLKIFDLDCSIFKMKTIDLTGTGVTTKHAPYQDFLSLAVSAYAAQRASNVAWIDADSFDLDYDPNNNLLFESLTDIRIYTDKVSPTGLNSKLPKEVMEMLLFARRLRNLNKDSSFVNPISYQSNENSKKGSLRPLLQNSRKNSLTVYNLQNYILLFEKSLVNSGIYFDSTLQYCPVNLRLSEFLYLKRLDQIPWSLNYKIRNSPSEQFVPFTSLERKTLLTTHSLRKQLVSVFDILLSDRDAIQMLTGQTSATIGYYAENTPEEEVAIKSNQQALLKHIVVPSDTAISQKEIENDIADKHHFIEKYKPITTHISHEIGSGIDDLDIEHEPALNWTHICPFNNECPPEIVRTIGRRNCHKCPKAIQSKHHAPAIAATVKMHLDDICEAHSAMSKEGILASEENHLRHKIAINVEQASSWKVRLDLINQQDLIVGDKDSIVANMKYMQPGTFKHNLWLRLQETENCHSLQSDKIQKLANRISRKLYLTMPELPKMLGKIDDDIEDNPVSFAVSSLKMVADFNKTTVTELLDDTTNDIPTSLLELFNE